MVKKKLKSAKKTKPKKPKAKPKSGGKNLHIAKLEKKLRKISAHIKKCKQDLQSIIRLKQIKSQMDGE